MTPPIQKPLSPSGSKRHDSLLEENLFSQRPPYRDLKHSEKDLRSKDRSKEHQPGFSSGFSLEKEASFEQSLARAHQEKGHSRDDEEDPPAEEDTLSPDLRLLAMCDAHPHPFLTSSAQETQALSSQERLEAFVDRLSERIEKAVRLEIGLSAGNTLSLKLNLTDQAQGLVGVALHITPTGLEVVLERTVSDLHPALLAAAQDLSQKLQARFSNKTIRILDRLVDPPKWQQHEAFSSFSHSPTQEEHNLS